MRNVSAIYFPERKPITFLGLPQITRRGLENGLQLKTNSLFLFESQLPVSIFWHY